MTIYRIIEIEWGTNQRITRKITEDKKLAEDFLVYMLSTFRKAYMEVETV